MNDPKQAIGPEPEDSLAGGPARLPATVAFSQFQPLERAAPDRTAHFARFRRPGELVPGDVVFSSLRDTWAVVTHATSSGPDATIRVQEAGGSRTIACSTNGPGFSVRADLRVDPSTIPDIPDGFPPRWAVWRNGPLHSGTLAWYPEPGDAAEHARQASRDGREYVVELEAPDGSWTEVDAYQQGRRSTWGLQLAAGQGRTVQPPWAVAAPGLVEGPLVKAAAKTSARPRPPAGGQAPRRVKGA
jgi:hypothetical protein